MSVLPQNSSSVEGISYHKQHSSASQVPVTDPVIPLESEPAQAHSAADGNLDYEKLLLATPVTPQPLPTPLETLALVASNERHIKELAYNKDVFHIQCQTPAWVSYIMYFHEILLFLLTNNQYPSFGN